MRRFTDGAPAGFATDATIQVMKAGLLVKDQTSYDDQASRVDYPGWHHNSADKYQPGRLTDEQEKDNRTFHGTVLDIKGYNDSNRW